MRLLSHCDCMSCEVHGRAKRGGGASCAARARGERGDGESEQPFSGLCGIVVVRSMPDVCFDSLLAGAEGCWEL